jgi:hypothetical protein
MFLTQQVNAPVATRETITRLLPKAHIRSGGIPQILIQGHLAQRAPFSWRWRLRNMALAIG